MPRALWILIIGMAIYVTGASFLWPLNAIYVHEQLDKPLSVAGLVLMLNSAATMIGNLLGGFLFDRLGGFRSLMVGALLALAAVISLIFFHGWPHYPILLAVIGFGVGIVFPVANAYAGAIWPQGGRRAFNALYVAQNIGVAIGSALGGWIASYSFDSIFIANAFMYILFVFIAYFGLKHVHMEKGRKQEEGKTVATNAGNRIVWNALIILCIGYFLCWLSYVQWSTTIAAYTQELNISLKQYSFLWTVNGALIVLAQPLLSAAVHRWLRQVKRQMAVGFAIFVGSFFILLQATSFFDFIAAMVVLTIAEMLVWPAIPTVASRLAPEGKEGFYQGFVNSTATAGRMIGPVLGGFIVDTAGMKPLFVALIIFSSISFVTAFLYDRKLPKGKNEKKQTVTIV
ncbi:dipeptide/tripeptide permease [Thermolongibacillus altinsuensis]|uniref:Dipeptide/tripeptide permease n=1 Tax=Thermolongibacillus altinsuensis TaxID=575256 RepID=A0A4R1QCF3_9BACL|nr:MFS transporter [Thermolongibacillus altinsuensis]TCL46561.1 dipeptide/tripeptide permease [Thermolongibacillus altinsuensis]